MNYRVIQCRRLGVKLLAALSFLVLQGGLAMPENVHGAEGENSTGPAGSLSVTTRSIENGSAKPKAPAGSRILFLGNSMTLHGPKPDIGWAGNWGMAASAADKDFVHIIIRSLAEKSGASPKVMIRNIAGFERQYATYDAGKQLREALDFKADTVIMAIGENVPELDSDQAKLRFKTSLMKLLRELKTNNEPSIFVRSRFWPNQTVDRLLKEACQEVGGTFVDIGGLGKTESNYARAERPFKHAGVAAHPGDTGMQAMAQAILEAIEKQREKKNSKR